MNVQSISAVTDSSLFQVVIFYDDTADITLISQLVVAIKQSSYTALANAAVYHLPGGLNTSDALLNAAVLAITTLPVVYLGFCSETTMYLLSQKVLLMRSLKQVRVLYIHKHLPREVCILCNTQISSNGLYLAADFETLAQRDIASSLYYRWFWFDTAVRTKNRLRRDLFRSYLLQNALVCAVVCSIVLCRN